MRPSKYLIPQETSIPENKRVLVLAPHPDDEIIGPGGTLIQMIEKGCTVKAIIFSRDNVPGLREEIQAVANLMGFDVEELGFPIMGIPKGGPSLDIVRQKIDSFAPDHIFLPFMLDDHPEHRLLSDILLQLYGPAPKESFEIWAYQVYTALPLNAVVNIKTSIRKKLEALKLYKSRFATRDWAHYTQGLNALNIRFLKKSREDDYAEVFLRVPFRHYMTLCAHYFSRQKS